MKDNEHQKYYDHQVAHKKVENNTEYSKYTLRVSSGCPVLVEVAPRGQHQQLRYTSLNLDFSGKVGS